MNISAITPYSQNFQARIKMNKPKLEVLAQSAIGTSALATGAATIAEGAFSMNAIGDNAYSIESIPKEVVDSHKGFLTSAAHRYDAAGETGGIPVQSTVAPSAMIASGIYASAGASNAYKNAFGEDNLKATTVIPFDASKAVSADKSAQKSMLDSSYIGTAAACLYSGINGQDGCGDAKKLADLALVTGGLSVSVPAALGSGQLASMASDTKSSQFVADTLSSEKTDKKLPS
jgi:hypothetical protein